jgi:hypothetical protein
VAHGRRSPGSLPLRALATAIRPTRGPWARPSSGEPRAGADGCGRRGPRGVVPDRPAPAGRPAGAGVGPRTRFRH